MKYASSAWIYGSTVIASALQVRQNKLRRVMTNVPWIVRNETLHRDLQLDDRLARHTNRLLMSELISEPWDGARYRRLSDARNP
jgi:hypothetical protein